MPRPPTWARAVLATALVTTLSAVLADCGESARPSAAAKAERARKQCQAQWREVGDSVLGMDQDTHPSALADRWTTVIATAAYYENSDSAKDCQTRIETQLKAVTALRQFSEKLRPYDMTYQRDQVRAAIDLYLNDPLPAPARGEDGRRISPPAKDAVRAAMQTLTDKAEQANAELQPGWQQTASVDLDDVAALTTTMKDLDFLAQDSPDWRACEEALQVLVAAVRAQEGLAGSDPVTPSGSPTAATTP